MTDLSTPRRPPISASVTWWIITPPFVRELPESPILMGHSFGGLITQMLLGRGLGRAGVAIHPAAPRGVYRLPLSVLRPTWPVFARPVESTPSGAPHACRVPLRVRQHRVAGRIRFLARRSWRSPRRAGRCSSPRWPTSCPRSRAATVVDYAKLRPGAAATDRRRPRPHHAVVGGLRELQSLPALGRTDGLQAFRGPTAFDGGVGRLERRGRLRIDVDGGAQRIV